MTKKSSKPSRKPSVRLNRATRRPTVSLGRLDRSRVLELAVAAFEMNRREPIDLEALVFVVLRGLGTTPLDYVQSYKTVRAQILANFAIEPGEPLTLVDVSMRRITVLWTTDEED